MARYRTDGMTERIAMTAIYTALTAPKGLDEDGFTEIVKKSGFPTRPIIQNRPFGITKEMERTEGTGNWRYLCREGFWSPEHPDGFVTCECNYRLLMPDTLIIQAQGLDVPSDDVNQVIDYFIENTGLKETDLPPVKIVSLETKGHDWAAILHEMREQIKYDGQ